MGMKERIERNGNMASALRTGDGSTGSFIRERHALALHRAVVLPLAGIFSAVVCALASGTNCLPVTVAVAAGVRRVVALLACVDYAVAAAIGTVLYAPLSQMTLAPTLK